SKKWTNNERRLRNPKKSTQRLLDLSYLKPSELRKARTTLIREDQTDSLNEVLMALKQPKKYQMDSNILQLTPRFDRNGVIRMFGRLESTPFLSPEIRVPVILGKKSRVARGLIYDFHMENNHFGSYQALWNLVKQKYCVIQGLSMCKKLIKECNYCKKKFAATTARKMGPLPFSRIPDSRRRLTPFAHVGIDNMGPLNVKNGDNMATRYLLVFVCMITRAIHIEVTVDKSTKSTTLALIRFQGRFGTPNIINTDNASNFLEIAREMEKLKAIFADKEINWTFNPPKAAWFGGHFEIFVGLIKKAIFKSTPNIDVILNDEELATLTSEIARMLNNRPLNYVSEDGIDTVLTPADFILGSQKTSEITCPESISRDFKKRYIFLKKYLDNIWKK
ncbi:Transposon Tf2-6 poly, partial, partial [Paramuricea clavata]